MFSKFAYDHKMLFYSDPSPRLLELMGQFGVPFTWFTPLQSLESARVH